MRACEYVYEPDKGILRDFHFRLHGSPDEVRKNTAHNVAHVLLAWHFGFPLPRWTESATELMDEDQESRIKRHQYVRRAIAEKKAYPIEKLFAVEDYPTPFGAAQLVLDQGATVTEFLIDRADRRTYLAFVGHGKQRGWDQALQTFYGLQDFKELESAWKDWLTANDPAAALRVEEDFVDQQHCPTKRANEQEQQSPVPVQAKQRAAAFLPREQRLVGVWKPEPGQERIAYEKLTFRADGTGKARIFNNTEAFEWDLVDDKLTLVRVDEMEMRNIPVVAITRNVLVIHEDPLYYRKQCRDVSSRPSDDAHATINDDQQAGQAADKSFGLANPLSRKLPEEQIQRIPKELRDAVELFAKQLKERGAKPDAKYTELLFEYVEQLVLETINPESTILHESSDATRSRLNRSPARWPIGRE